MFPWIKSSIFQTLLDLTPFRPSDYELLNSPSARRVPTRVITIFPSNRPRLPPAHPDSCFCCFWGHRFLHLLLLPIDRCHFYTRKGPVAVIDHNVDGTLQFLHSSILILRL